MIVTKYGKLSPADTGLEYMHVKCPRCKTRALLSDKDVISRSGGIVRYQCPLCGHDVDSTTASPIFRFLQTAVAVAIWAPVVLPVIFCVIYSIFK